MTPFIRHMLLCEAVRPRPADPRKVDVLGLLSSVRVADGAFPTAVSFSVYLATTGGRGSGEARIVVVDADSGAGDRHDLPHPDVLAAASGVILGRVSLRRNDGLPSTTTRKGVTDDRTRDAGTGPASPGR